MAYSKPSVRQFDAPTSSDPPPTNSSSNPRLPSTSRIPPPSLPSIRTDASGYLLSSSLWLEPPSTFPPMSRTRSLSTSTSSSTDSYDSELELEADREAQLQFEESLKQLQSLVNLVLVPWVSRYFGRKWSYYRKLSLYSLSILLPFSARLGGEERS